MRIDNRIEKLTAAQISAWLVKTSSSINSQSYRGCGDCDKDYRLGSLITRFDEMKERAVELGIWESFCTSQGWAIEVNGFDCAG